MCLVGCMEKPGSWSRCSRNDGKGELEHKAQQESGLGRRPRHRFVLVAEALSKEIPFYCLVCSVWAQGQGSEGFTWAPQAVVSPWGRALWGWSRAELWWAQI